MLVWDDTSSKTYETGVDRAVLFPLTSTGVPWNGLVSVSVDVSGGESEELYYDGTKYLDVVDAEAFQATITAFSAPREFSACEGVVKDDVIPGLYVPFGPRAKFAMCWRTRIGNDIEQSDYAYKLHLLYNATVMPSARSWQTLSDSTTPENRSFQVKATPACGRYSYFVFDSREADLTSLEAQLYNGVLVSCSDLGLYVGPPPGGGGSLPPPSDAGCPSLTEDLESYLPGQVVNETVTVTTTTPSSTKTIYGVINTGLDVTEIDATGTFTVNDSTATEVGTHPVLGDGLDTTYIDGPNGDLGYTVGLPPLIGYVDGADLELHIRLSVSGDISADDPDLVADADAQVFITTDAAGDLAVGGFSDGTDDGMGFAIPYVDGSINDYVVPLNMDAWIDTTIDDVVAALEAGAYLNVVSISNNNYNTTPDIRVYEASVVMLNDTDPELYLRASAPTSYAEITETVGDGSSASVSDYVDFKITKVNQSADAVGDVVDVLVTQNTAGTSHTADLRVDLSGDAPILKFFDVSATAEAATATPELNQWYRAQLDWGWATMRIRVFNRDTREVILDHSNTAAAEPWPYAQFLGGFLGNTNVTYEVGVDNAEIQVHCNAPAPATMVIDLPAWHCNDSGGADFANPARFTTKDDSGDYAIGPSGRIGVGYFAETDQGAVVSGQWVYMPATPSGYTLTRATYVVRAYAASGHAYTGSPLTGYTPSPATSPYLNAESSGTMDNYAIDHLSTSGFVETEWSGNEVLSRLTNPPGSQLPCMRLWNEWADTYDATADIHVSYYAIRLYYDLV